MSAGRTDAKVRGIDVDPLLAPVCTGVGRAGEVGIENGELPLGMSFTSQVKPGPNMDAAVKMKVSRRVSRDEKDISKALRNFAERILEGSWGFGV